MNERERYIVVIAEQADRIEALEAVINGWQLRATVLTDRIETLEAENLILKTKSDLAVQNRNYWHTAANSDAARIAALEAALRFMLTDPPAALDEPDTDAEVIRQYREVARAALAPEQNK